MYEKKLIQGFWSSSQLQISDMNYYCEVKMEKNAGFSEKFRSSPELPESHESALIIIMMTAAALMLTLRPQNCDTH